MKAEAGVTREQDDKIVKAAIALIDQLNTFNDISHFEVVKRLIDLQKTVSVYWEYNQNLAEPETKICHFCGADAVLTPVTKKVYTCTKCGAEGETLVRGRNRE